jgi:uncharacterized protein (DUF2126 family)/transglutaminase-like putative cysteine protease
MAVRVALRHVTHYGYDRPVELGPHVVRLRPASHARTPILAYSLRVGPGKHFLSWQQDPLGNHEARVVFLDKRLPALRVEVELIAELSPFNPFDFFLEPGAEALPVQYEERHARELAPYLEVAASGPRFEQLVAYLRGEVAQAGRRSVDVLVDLNRVVQRALRYDIRLEPGVFTPEETLTRGHGSCRDFAWLVVNLLRALGLGARFVSGYSIQLVADQKPVDGPAGVSADCTDLHAWAEVYLPGAGWVGLDATSGLLCGEGHIPLSCTADPQSAAPIEGAFAFDAKHEGDVVEQRFAVEMSVERVEDRPRPSKAMSEDTWQALLRAGQAVDQALAANDVRLTMGGEPTFVAAADPDGDEWNTTAVGPTKRGYADRLARRLMARYAPGGVLHHGQGKWYPGESLPRWAYTVYFRRDGQALWREPSLLARDDARQAHGALEASRFAERLALRLGVDARHLRPAYEDVFYYLWRERRLPRNVDPFDARLDDPEERARLLRVFARGLPEVVGYALPLREAESGGFESGAFLLRDERMYLLPGDSAMGYRLPLDSLPWEPVEDRDRPLELDPFAARPPLPARAELLQDARVAGRAGSARGSRNIASGAGATSTGAPPTRNAVRTALCLEPRDGILRLFLPPLGKLEAFCALVAAIEDTAAELELPLQLEGYHPPRDPRLAQLSVTPDPGVIEVNVHPSGSFDELVDVSTGLYDEARAEGLVAEKFMLDGRHVGSGGGNHITLGGPTPDQSPFLHRPDLLRSLTAYFLNHPSLSYLFSGLFVGPTSQAPRIDEARHDSLYELEIAFDELDRRGGEPPPWLVDRLFRNLLVDATGNTHRTELCIDKLYSPDGPSGRQGLIELRAFEMPPDARMSCAAQLLVRALVAWFWEEPYRVRPVRYGTQRLDRFMLPRFVEQDFREVLDDLREAGFPLDPAFFAAQQELRFPLLGRVGVDSIELALRMAIEPWHVLGEEQGQGGTVRYVDSSVERIEVRAQNVVDGRHVVTVNGRRLPLCPTGTAGEQVAGVRYRAWQPAACLHPTIAPHTPLVFDVIDVWSGRALGGCTYHVAHPNGRAYDVRPRNALEAESRRTSRFWPFSHTPGVRAVPPEEHNPELPLTLDLRRG